MSTISSSFDVPDAVFTFQQDLDLYSDSTALTAGGSGGLTGAGFAAINDASSRWNTPLSVGVRVRF